MPVQFDDPGAHARATRNVVMLTDHWGGWTTGIASITQSLASQLSSFASVGVYCIVLSTSDSPASNKVHDDVNSTVINCETGLSVPVRLIHVNLVRAVAAMANSTFRHQKQRPTAAAAANHSTLENVRYAFEQFNEKTADMLTASSLIDMLPDQASYIVGHAPVSAAAALTLRKAMYPNSKVVVLYHCIPDELERTAKDFPFPVPDTEDLIRIAEASDVVYSVTPKIHAYFEARFRSSARIAIDHRLLVPLPAKNLFDINGSTLRSMSDRSACFCIVALATGGGVEDWMGIDIAVCAAGKVAAALAARRDVDGDVSTVPQVNLTILNIDPTQKVKAREVLQNQIKAAEKAGARIVLQERPSDPWQAGPYRQLTTGACYDICLVPTRCEPYGQVGLEAISAGIPTLVSKQSVIASMIQRLTAEPSKYLVKTTQDATFVRQDAAEWCQRVLDVIDRPQEASERALMLQGALKRDEYFRNTHDDFIAWCLGGIGVKFQLTQMQFVNPLKIGASGTYPSRIDGPRELTLQRSFNYFTLGVLRQAWRVKRHPLQTVDELPVLLEKMPRLPICQLIAGVINLLEDKDRRIVAIDCDKDQLVIYCPDLYALRDLWAICDRVNGALRSVLLPPGQDYSENPVMVEYGLRRAATSVSISGPEYLHYKERLILLLQQQDSLRVL